MESLTFIIIAVIITSIGFLIGYQMIRLRKNVDKITDQIIEHHKGDRSFRDKEFVHYFKAGGNIWLSAMDDKFKKNAVHAEIYRHGCHCGGSGDHRPFHCAKGVSPLCLSGASHSLSGKEPPGLPECGLR